MLVSDLNIVGTLLLNDWLCVDGWQLRICLLEDKEEEEEEEWRWRITGFYLYYVAYIAVNTFQFISNFMLSSGITACSEYCLWEMI